MNGLRVEQQARQRRIAASRRLPPLASGVVDPLVTCGAFGRLLRVNEARQRIDPALDYWHATFMDRGLAEREAAGRGWLT